MFCSIAGLQDHTPQRDCKNHIQTDVSQIQTQDDTFIFFLGWRQLLEFWRSIYNDVLTRPFSIPFFFNILTVDVLKDVGRATFVSKFYVQKINNQFWISCFFLTPNFLHTVKLVSCPTWSTSPSLPLCSKTIKI